MHPKDSSLNVALVVRGHWPGFGGSEVHQHLLASCLSERHQVKVLAQLCDDRELTIAAQTFLAPRFAPYRDGEAWVYPLPPSPMERLALSPFSLYHTLYYNTPIVSRYKQPLKRLYSHLFSAVFTAKIAKLIRGCDLVHSFNGEFIGMAACLAAKEEKIPYVMTPQVHPGRWLDDRFNLDLYRKADAIFAALNYDRQFYIENGVAQAKVHVVGGHCELAERYNAVEFRHRHGIADEPMVLFIGVKRQHKGFEALLEAADQVWGTFPETRFVFIGPQPKTHPPTDAFARYRDPRLLDLGLVSLEEKTSALAATDIFCLPSNTESFGSVFVEAWMFGKPVIACDIPSSRELLEDGKAGLLVEQRPSDIAAALVRLLGDKDLSARLGQAGKVKALGNYTPEVLAGRVEAVYYGVIGSPAAEKDTE